MTVDPDDHTLPAPSAQTEEALWASIGLAVGDVIGGKYELTARLGRGGMGAVFEAMNLAIRRVVAIKVMRAELSSDPLHATRFQREARAAAEVRHPAIVDILDFGVHEGRPFIVMEKLEGESLRAKVARSGRLRVPEAIETLDVVLRALSAAHARGVIHRDIKPDNIFLARAADDEERAQVKVLDFGIAKLESGDDPALTVSRVALGTASYMAPEQVRAAGEVDARADQYAAAVVLYETLTGRLPHQATTYNEMIIQKVTEPPRDLAELRPDLPAELTATVMQALRPSPGERFEDVDALRAALAPFADLHEHAALVDPLEATMVPSTPAPPVVSPASVPRIPRLHRALLVTLALLALAAVAAVVWLSGREPTPTPEEGGEAREGELASVLRVRDARQITHNPDRLPVLGASLSPDGALLAYVDAEGLHVRNLREGTTDDYPSPEGARPWDVAWMPEGLRVLVTAQRDGASRIYVLGLVGREPRWEMLRDGAQPAVDPSGARVAYWDGATLGLMRTDGSSAGALEEHPARSGTTAPVWSSDGAWLAWLAEPPGEEATLHAIELGEGAEVLRRAEVEVPRAPVEDFSPIWLPSGELVYTVTAYLGEQSRSELRARTLDRAAARWREPREVPACLTDHCYVMSASADGARVAIEVWRERVDVMTLELDGSEPEVLVDRDATELATGWAVDGEGVLIGSDETGRYGVYLAAANRARPVPVAIGASAHLFGTATPDGEHALLWRTEETDDGVAFRLVRAPLDGSAAPSPLGEHAGTDALSDLYLDYLPLFPPYSQRVVCRRDRCLLSRGDGSALVFHELDAATGELTERARVSYPWQSRATFWRPGVDDDVLLLSHAPDGAHRLDRVALADGVTTPIELPSGCDPDSMEAGRDGELFVTCRGRGGQGWRIVRVADGEATELWRHPSGEIRMPLLHPTDDRLVFTTAPFNSDVFLLDASAP